MKVALHVFPPVLLCTALCRDASLLVSAVLLLALALGVGSLGLIPVTLPGPAQPIEVALLLQGAAAADASGGCCVCHTVASCWSLIPTVLPGPTQPIERALLQGAAAADASGGCC
jgi:hypothetical protein